MGHTCSKCGEEFPSPGGLAIHELSHLAPAPKPPSVQAPDKGTRHPKASAGAASKERTRHRRSKSAVDETETREGPPSRRRRRPSRAMSTGATFETRLEVGPARAPTGPAPEERRNIDSTVPLTAVLVVVALVGGLVAAVTHSPARVTLATGDGAVWAGASVAGLAGPVDPAAVAACRPAVDAVTAPASTRSVDLADHMRKGSFPALPLEGFEKPAVTGPSRYDSVAEYLAGRPVLDPALWLKTLSSSGFRGAAAVIFKKGTETYGAETVQLGSPASAAEYNRATLSAVCAAGRMTDAQPIPELPGSLAYVSSEPGLLPHRASIVIGDSVAQLSLCDCVHAPDRQALVAAWARAVVTQLNAV